MRYQAVLESVQGDQVVVRFDPEDTRLSSVSVGFELPADEAVITRPWLTQQIRSRASSDVHIQWTEEIRRLALRERDERVDDVLRDLVVTGDSTEEANNGRPV